MGDKDAKQLPKPNVCLCLCDRCMPKQYESNPAKVQATHEEIVQAGQYLYNVFTDWKQFKDETKWAEILANYAAWKAESGRTYRKARLGQKA